MPFTTLKIAVLPPIPSASVMTVKVNPSDWLDRRTVSRTSITVNY